MSKPVSVEGVLAREASMCFGFVRALRLLCVVLGCGMSVQAQEPPAVQAPGAPVYTLHVNTRVVLTDVTVLDRHGNPVQGLDQSQFRIYDDGQPEEIASFTEHTGAEEPTAAAEAKPGEFSNDFLQSPPAALDVILLDLTTIALNDQLYLGEQLRKLVAVMPAGHFLAVYLREGDAVVRVQDFTTDRALLGAAFRKTVPHLQQPGSWASNDLQTLHQMVGFLRQYPGRKNLIWYSGGSNLGLMVDASRLPAFVNMRPIYDELEATRIAVYPVDARGLTVTFSLKMVFQQMQMDDTAQATGGHAFYNTNGLEDAARRVVSNSSHFYTLSYHPADDKLDNKWHKVKVEVEDKKYDLSYRRGYYDDGSNLPQRTSGERAALAIDGVAPHKSPDVTKAPILFSATVLPVKVTAAEQEVSGDRTAPAKRDQTRYNIRFSLPAADFEQQTGQGRTSVTIGIGIFGLNRLGTRVAQSMKTVEAGIDVEKLHATPRGTIGIDEQIDLPKGDAFLYLVAWDEHSGRFGMVDAPVTVPKAKK